MASERLVFCLTCLLLGQMGENFFSFWIWYILCHFFMKWLQRILSSRIYSAILSVPSSVLTSPALHLKSSFLSAPAGGEVTWRCSYEGDESAWICWYKQTLGQNPKLISSFFVYSPENIFHGEFENNSRFTLIRKNRTTNQLIISDLKVSDSGTYYSTFTYAQIVSFSEGATVIIKNLGSDIRPSVLQSEPESIRPGDAVTLNCSVQTGSCGGERSVYWFRKSEESHPGLFYTHGGERDRCERNPNAHMCVQPAS